MCKLHSDSGLFLKLGAPFIKMNGAGDNRAAECVLLAVFRANTINHVVRYIFTINQAKTRCVCLFCLAVRLKEVSHLT